MKHLGVACWFFQPQKPEETKFLWTRHEINSSPIQVDEELIVIVCIVVHLLGKPFNHLMSFDTWTFSRAIRKLMISKTRSLLEATELFYWNFTDHGNWTIFWLLLSILMIHSSNHSTTCWVFIYGFFIRVIHLIMIPKSRSRLEATELLNYFYRLWQMYHTHDYVIFIHKLI